MFYEYLFFVHLKTIKNSESWMVAEQARNFTKIIVGVICQPGAKLQFF